MDPFFDCFDFRVHMQEQGGVYFGPGLARARCGGLQRGRLMANVQGIVEQSRNDEPRISTPRVPAQSWSRHSSLRCREERLQLALAEHLRLVRL
jgi:hypothetical protein